MLASTMKRKEATRLKLFTVRLPEPLIDRLKFRALKEHTSVQTLMRQAVEELLKKKPEGANNG
jgi:predicted DNA binding CopG/RHH family protein